MEGAMRARIAAAALVALALAAMSAAPAGAARGMEIGLQDDSQFLDGDAAVRGAAFAHAGSLRASSLRANVPWASVVSDPAATTAPSAASFDFSRYDRLVSEAAAHGIRVQLTLTGDAPAWATGDHKISNDHPDPARFAEFAAAVASHFNGRVRALSIWNEPNWHGLLKPEQLCGTSAKKAMAAKKGKSKAKGKGKGKAKGKSKARGRVCVKTSALIYRELYRAGYAAIKQVAPGMPVWIGETNPYVNRRKQSTPPMTWLRQLVCLDPVVKRCRGGTLKADGYAHHPYDFARAPNKKRKSANEITLANIGKLSKFLRKNRKRIRVARNSLYLTEFAYYSSGPNAQPEARRAKWTKQAFDIALKAPNVRQLLYYQLFDPATTRVFRTGLVSLQGVKHPVYNSLQALYNARKSRLTQPRPFTPPPPPFGF
jgi:hypothetical protein